MNRLDEIKAKTLNASFGGEWDVRESNDIHDTHGADVNTMIGTYPNNQPGADAAVLLQKTIQSVYPNKPVTLEIDPINNTISATLNASMQELMIDAITKPMEQAAKESNRNRPVPVITEASEPKGLLQGPVLPPQSWTI